MSNRHLEWVWDRSVQYGLNPHWVGPRLQTQCPCYLINPQAHADTSRDSLHWTVGDSQPIIAKCRAGCEWNDILTAIDTDSEQMLSDDPYEWAIRRQAPHRLPTVAGLAPPPPVNLTPGVPREKPPARNYGGDGGRKPGIECHYAYYNADGEVYFEVWRWPKDPKTGKKSFTQAIPGPELHTFQLCAPDQYSLYRLSQLLTASLTDPVFVCAGEKDADNVAALGLLATTNPGGEGWRGWDAPGFIEPLRGRHLILLEDNDPAGQKWGQYLLPLLSTVAASVRILRLVGLPPGGDVSDWIEQDGLGSNLPDKDGHVRTLKELLCALANGVPAWKEGAIGPFDQIVDEFDDFTWLPKFPVHVFPPALQKVIRDGAKALPCPAEYIAAPLLISIATAIGRKTLCAVKSSYTVPAILWIVTIGFAGFKKTPGLRIGTHAIGQLQEQSHDHYKVELATYREEFARWEKDRSSERPRAPRFDHWMTTDFTMEALIGMAETSTGFAMIRDELAGWFGSMDLYRQGLGGDKQNWMSSWSSERIIVDRKSGELEDRHREVKHPHICVYGTIQPGVFKSYANKLGFSDGFVDRLLVIYPDGVENRWNEETIDHDAQAEIYQLLKRIRYGNLPPIVSISPRAKLLWREWYNANAKIAETSRGMRASHALKLEGMCARIALILHCAEFANCPGADQITYQTMYHAIEVAEFFRAHSERVYRDVCDESPDIESDEGKVYNAITRAVNIKGDAAATAEVWKHIRHDFKASKFAVATKNLKRDGYILHRYGNLGTGGGRASDLWLPTPLLPTQYHGVDLSLIESSISSEVARLAPSDGIAL